MKGAREARDIAWSPLEPLPARGGRRSWLWIWAAITLGVGLLLFLYRYLAELAEGNEVAAAIPLITEMTAAVGGGLLFLPLRSFVLRFPLEHGRIAPRLPAYAAALVVYSVALTSFMWATRSLLFPLAGLGWYDYGRMPLRYLMEFPIQLVGFCIMVGAVLAVRRLRAARDRETRSLQLESSLARSQLENLRLQLQPHFLFNALNTVSAVMYEDPRAADEVVDRLGELLRTSLRTGGADEVPLSVELGVLDCYLDIMRARFGERLDVSREIDPPAREAMVPSMILQPLVENAVRHGNAERTGRGRIRVSATVDGESLVLCVDDDGPGTGPDERLLGKGLGLSSTVERLRLLYGERQQLTATNVESGFRVTLRLPYRRAGGS